MRTDNFYKVIIIVLLLINIGTLAYLWRSQGHRGFDGHHPPPPPERMIIERLQLTDAQQQQFEGLKHEHHSQMLDIQKHSSELHNTLFALLKRSPVDTIQRDSLMRLLDDNNRQKELVTFEHFRKLRAILTPAQQTEFDSFVEELSRRIMGPHRPPPGEERP